MTKTSTELVQILKAIQAQKLLDLVHPVVLKKIIISVK